jgi:hypothetical protein
VSRLLTELKKVGLDLSHVAVWINDGLKAVEPEVALADPPLGVLFNGFENFISGLQTEIPLTAQQIQLIVTDITTLVGKLQPPAATVA